MLKWTMADLDGMIIVLTDAMALLRRPGNDFAWSSWESEAGALSELSTMIAELRDGSGPDRLQMEVLFAPTGPMQDVSVSSGWGPEFLALADRFDRELSRISPQQSEDHSSPRVRSFQS